MKNSMSEFTILIVDDHTPHVLLAEMILKEEGYSLLSASCGKEGVEIARKNSPHLILLAFPMDETSGYETLKELKSYPGTTHIPVIITSRQQDIADIEKVFRLGAIEHLQYPLKTEELACRIRHHYEFYQLKRMRRELEYAIESHNLLYSMLTQALYSPLNSLKVVNSSLLRIVDRKQIGEDGFDMLQTMNHTTVEMSLCLNNMQQVIKLNQHKLKAHKQIADMNSIIDEVVETYRPVAALKNVTIYTQGLEKDLTGEIDIDMIQTILQNLLSNAIKFNSTGGAITISSASLPNGIIQVSVKDSGVGLNQEKVEHLFPPTVPKTSGIINEYGSGLGLLVCRAFIEAHAGRFWVESEEGKGATFSFSLKASARETK
ncbi:MAG: hybrid sensor histidine kinase/response regulator [Tannerellaceae bacterium]|nr:hybrid sensor histidine kinase/response regulator [Tannerellaceae bacterium]